jgi:hypothetical protein
LRNGTQRPGNVGKTSWEWHSPLVQDVFGGHLIGVSATFDQLTAEQKTQIAAIAAGLTGLLSLFNIAGLLALGFLCNLLIEPVDPKHHMTPEQIAAADEVEKTQNGASAAVVGGAGEGKTTWLVPAARLAVWIPLGWGIWVTLQKAVLLFK